MKRTIISILTLLILVGVTSCTEEEESNRRNLEKRLTKGWIDLLSNELALYGDHTYYRAGIVRDEMTGIPDLCALDRGTWSLSADSCLTLNSNYYEAIVYKIKDLHDKRFPSLDLATFQQLGSTQVDEAILGRGYEEADRIVNMPIKYENEEYTWYKVFYDEGETQVTYCIIHENKTSTTRYIKQHWFISPSRSVIYSYLSKDKSERYRIDVDAVSHVDYIKRKYPDFKDPECEYTAQQIRDMVLANVNY